MGVDVDTGVDVVVMGLLVVAYNCFVKFAQLVFVKVNLSCTLSYDKQAFVTLFRIFPDVVYIKFKSPVFLDDILL